MTEQTGLYAKMVRVMAQMGRIPKRGHNTHFRYDFVTDGDVLDAVGAALVAEELALFVSFDSAERHDKGVTVGSFTLTFVDAETGQQHAVNWIGEGQDTQDKGAAKAATSAVKYALLKTFLISTGDAADDPDADLHANGHKPQATGKAAAADEPKDLWDEEAQEEAHEEKEQAPPSFVADTVKVLMTKKNTPYLMFTGGDLPGASWFKGRDELLTAAPWIGKQYSKDAFKPGVALPLSVRVEYEVSGQYRNAVAFAEE